MARALQSLRRLGAAAVGALYPPTCMLCEARVEEDGGLCPSCWREMPFVRGPACALCGVPLPGDAGDAGDTEALRCDGCLSVARPWAAGRAALLYEGRGRAFVLGLKHHDRAERAEGAAGWLLRAGRDLIGPETAFVPVPLHPWRLWRRRYNQAALIAGALARRLGAEHAPLALRRVRATPAQAGDREARFGNLRGAVLAHPRHAEALRGREVALVDDVMTSGATLAACAEALAPVAPARIVVLTLARVARA